MRSSSYVCALCAALLVSTTSAAARNRVFYPQAQPYPLPAQFEAYQQPVREVDFEQQYGYRGRYQYDYQPRARYEYDWRQRYGRGTRSQHGHGIEGHDRRPKEHYRHGTIDRYGRTTRKQDAYGTTKPRPTSSKEFLRGVNIGGWLVLEKWMTPEVFSGMHAEDQWTFDGQPGAQEKLRNHWNTFFTQKDMQWLRQVGINAIRIPIGFWAYDNRETPYLQGADAYLERAIHWAKQAGMKVWVDLHGLPGSQNGFDNSGKAGSVEWQRHGNMERSIRVLQYMARKYGSMDYAGTVVGLQLANEPISWGNNDLAKTKQWTVQAYQAVRREIANPNLMVVMHDAFQGPGAWKEVSATLKTNGLFGIDSHLYQCFVEEDSRKTQDEHVQQACGRSGELRDANGVMPTFVGEWSPATNICVNPDGSTTPGKSCSVQGCQCQTAPFESWNDKMVAQVRRYVEAQLDTFESSTSGYFMWSYKAPGAWGFVNGIQKGFIPSPVTDRQFPGVCRQQAGHGGSGAAGDAVKDPAASPVGGTPDDTAGPAFQDPAASPVGSTSDDAADDAPAQNGAAAQDATDPTGEQPAAGEQPGNYNNPAPSPPPYPSPSSPSSPSSFASTSSSSTPAAAAYYVPDPTPAPQAAPSSTSTPAAAAAASPEAVAADLEPAGEAQYNPSPAPSPAPAQSPSPSPSPVYTPPDSMPAPEYYGHELDDDADADGNEGRQGRG